jgi:PIN domain nuclease of toxin-antitoxin system
LGIAIKASLFRHIVRRASMQPQHGGSFDWLLAAQARERHLPIVCRDPAFELDGIRRIWWLRQRADPV